MSLLDCEKKYCNSLINSQKKLKNVYSEIKSNIPLFPKERDITKAILIRMKAYYTAQEQIKEFLNKERAAPASDFFVEAIAFYLKLFLDKKGSAFKVYSEKTIRVQQRKVRPDISVWENDTVVALIECKTQLGWARKDFEEQLKNKESTLKDICPNAKIFVVVMTKENWPGFPDNNKKVGKQYFTLSSVWPTKIDDNVIDSQILNPIEDLFCQLV